MKIIAEGYLESLRKGRFIDGAKERESQVDLDAPLVKQLSSKKLSDVSLRLPGFTLRERRFFGKATVLPNIQQSQVVAPLVPNIQDLETIRIIISNGGGFGHQRVAISVMLRMIELGFKGRFDIHYDDMYPDAATAANADEVGSVGQRLELLFPGYKATPISEQDTGTKLSSPTLGEMTITRLPNIHRGYSPDPSPLIYPLSPVLLTVSGAEDGYLIFCNCCERFNTAAYIQLQPTDWSKGGRLFIEDFRVQGRQGLPDDARLTAPPIFSENPLSLVCNTHQSNLLNLCRNKNLNTQLAYGFMPRKGAREWASPIDEFNLLMRAHLELHKVTGLNSVILFPQTRVFDDVKKPCSALFYGDSLWIDIEELVALDLDEMPKILVVNTKGLPPHIFDRLMLTETTLPPVTEGCNSKEACESARRLYIQGGRNTEEFRHYPLPDFSEEQDLQAAASRCLTKCKGAQKGDFEALVSFMLKALRGELADYAKARQTIFLQRPDACYSALKALSIKTKIDEPEAKVSSESDVSLDQGIRI